jgi:putative membrane protein
MRIRHLVVLFSLAFSSAALAADPSSDPNHPNDDPNQKGTQVGPATGTGTTADQGMQPMNDQMPQKPMEQLDNGQIYEAALELNRMEREHGEYIQKKSKNKQVIAYAKMMEQDHEMMIDNLHKWGHDADVRAKDSNVEDRISDKSHDGMEKLQKLKGKQLDREYIDMMVMGHEKALMKLDNWSAMATDPGLKMVLQNARPRVEAHHAEARRIQGELGGTQTSGAAQPTNNVAPVQ